MEKDIKELTKEEITNPFFITSIFEEYGDNNEKRQEILSEVLDVAREYRVLTKVQHNIDRCINTSKISNMQNFLILNSQGKPEPTTESYTSILEKDKDVNSNFYYDEFRGTVVKQNEFGEMVPWTDSDDSMLRHTIEKKYGIYNQQKYYDAFTTVALRRKFHPIKQIIEAQEWDGIPRIDKFLIDIAGCDDDDYSREVSRMIFYGGINRLYHPGCKFDYMPIFISNQGAGKSSLVNWLGLEKYSTDVYTIDGKDGMEVLQGAWICEMGELLAMTRTKEIEAMKAYITRTVDNYRSAYERRATERPRRCIFIGTTNEEEFLIDKTGNRRYLPIRLKCNGRTLFAHKEAIQNYILYCWREALYLMKKGETYLIIDNKYADLLLEKQAEMTFDDPRLNTIRSYLMDKPIGYKVCLLEIYTKCLNGLKKNYSGYAEGKDLTRIMKQIKGWEREARATRLDEYGPQKCWIKIEKDEFEDVPIEKNEG